MRETSKLLLLIALVISAGVLVAAGLASHRAIVLLAEARNQTSQSRDVLRALDHTVTTLLDAETGQRGFLLTGKEAYLQPYSEALASSAPRLDELRNLVKDDPLLAADFASLQESIRKKTDELAQTIRLYKDGDHDGALRLVMTDAGKRSMDEIRSASARMEAVERAKYLANVQSEGRAQRLTLVSSWATAGLAIALLGLLAFIVDRDAARIRASEMQLATTLRSIGDAVVATDQLGRIVLMNPVAERLTGWNLTEARGEHLDRVFHIINEDTRELVESPVAKVLRAGIVVGLANHTLLLRRDGSEIPIADSGAPIFSNSGKILGVVLVFRDASPERDHERSMRDADQRKDEFLATLSHELRNPLAPIRQAVGVIRAPAANPTQIRWSVTVIERQVQNMARLLDDLLDVSRITRGTLEVRKAAVSLRAVLDAAVELARPAIEAKQHVFTIECPDDLLLNVDSLRLAQVVGNLLTNSAKYTDSGGEIRLSARKDSEELLITVKDNGIGISTEMLPRIFEMFVQAHQAGHRSNDGLGIGLALARGLVALHGGTIEARSAGLGAGSEVLVRLPLRSHGTLAEPADEPAPQKAPVKVRIVVADDNLDAAESLAMLLRLHGHEVHVAHNGESALALLEAIRPQVALLDVGMPKLTGHEVATQARSAAWGSEITLIALTGWGQESDRNAALAAGFDSHFVKPVDSDAILRAIQSGQLAGRRAPGMLGAPVRV
jgi:PAS domain S-box-containing protein